jgi:hypothetical protein
MSKRPRRAAAKEPGVPPSLPVDPRYEIVFERSTFGTAHVSDLLSGVASAGRRIGAALGDGYARVARIALSGIERLEDANAERRLHRRTSRPSAPGRASPPPTSSPPEH